MHIVYLRSHSRNVRPTPDGRVRLVHQSCAGPPLVFRIDLSESRRSSLRFPLHRPDDIVSWRQRVRGLGLLLTAKLYVNYLRERGNALDMEGIFNETSGGKDVGRMWLAERG